jgi:hypothetical protein
LESKDVELKNFRSLLEQVSEKKIEAEGKEAEAYDLIERRDDELKVKQREIEVMN